MRRFFFRYSWQLALSAGMLSAAGTLLPLSVSEEPPSTGKPPIVSTPQDASPQVSAKAPTQPSPSQREEPRVAERIDLDPSIVETPALPVDEGTDPSPGAFGHVDDGIIPALEASQPQEGTPPDEQEPAPIVEAPPAPVASWPQPAGLLAQLDKLEVSDPAAQEWLQQVRAEATSLVALPTLTDAACATHLARLQSLADDAKQLAKQAADENSRSRILRAGFAVQRRVAIWQPVHAAALRYADGSLASAEPVPASEVLVLLESVDAALESTGAGEAWRKYLLTEKLRERCSIAAAITPEDRQLARDILYRLNSTQLSESQAAFLTKEEFKSLTSKLQGWAFEQPDLAALVAALETYEQAETAGHSINVANHYDSLRWSEDEGVRELADAVNNYYRNANVRVALSAELVNRLLPKELRTAEPVWDNIQGATVEGQSETSTRLRLVLLPDRFRWRLGLEAKGEVASSTSSTSGPATFYQDGSAFYRARKLLTIDRTSIRMHQAEAEANAQSQLNDFQTDFDGIPLFGALARAIARNQYDQKSPLATQEVEGKIINRAASELDEKVTARLEQAKKDFQSKLLAQLQQLQLDPTAVDMETTQERLIARYRLAGREQLSAHTPRPQAPGDSLLSVQLHETALNNSLEHLHLHGRKIELHDLFREMTARFAPKPVPIPEDLPEGVFVTFAKEDPVRIDCEDGRLRLMIHLQQLSATNEGKTWKNLIVKGYYKPDANQLDANLVRDGIIELSGNRLGLGDRALLAGIFEKVLSRNRKLNLVNERLSSSPELRDQQVTQFVIYDGWIGIALGPKMPNRTAERPAPRGLHLPIPLRRR